MRRRFLAAAVVVMSACGGGTDATPTQPSPTPQPNRNPSITSMAITPSFGIQQLTTFAFQGDGSDPDGDSLTYQWDVAGNPFNATSGTISFGSGGIFQARLTVSDGRGGTATDTRSFVVGTLTGEWTGTWGDGFQFTANLTQNGNLISGNYVDQAGPATLDPAVPHTIDAAGNIRLRFKGGPWTDFTFTGQMDQTGRRVSGTVNDGFYNSALLMIKP